MRTTIYDVAKISGVSISTVSKALRENSRISKETITKIKSIAKELNYTPNSIARALATSKTQTLGVITSSDIGNPFFTKVFNGMQEAADKMDYNVLFSPPSISYRVQGGSVIQKFLKRGIDGLMLFPHVDDVKDIEYLIESKFPFVLFSRHMFDDRADFVINDYEKGSYDITRHLIKLGHSAIAYVGFTLNTSTNCEKMAGYKKALLEHGIFKEELIFLTQITESVQNLPQIVSWILALKERPTAIFTVDDEEAIKLIKILKEKGLKVPEAIAVVGYGNMDLGELYDPSITTVDQFGYEVGLKTAELLIDKIAGKANGNVQHIVLEPKLVIRKSCGAYLSSESGVVNRKSEVVKRTQELVISNL